MSPWFCTPGSGSKRHGLVLLTFVLSSYELLLEPCFQLGHSHTATCVKFHCRWPICWRCPRLPGRLGQCLGTVPCHRRFGNSIGGKAHRHPPRRSQIAGFPSSNTNTSANVLLGEVQAVLQLSMKGGCLCSHPTQVRLHSRFPLSLSPP